MLGDFDELLEILLRCLIFGWDLRDFVSIWVFLPFQRHTPINRFDNAPIVPRDWVCPCKCFVTLWSLVGLYQGGVNFITSTGIDTAGLISGADSPTAMRLV